MYILYSLILHLHFQVFIYFYAIASEYYHISMRNSKNADNIQNVLFFITKYSPSHCHKFIAYDPEIVHFRRKSHGDALPNYQYSRSPLYPILFPILIQKRCHPQI